MWTRSSVNLCHQLGSAKALSLKAWGPKLKKPVGRKWAIHAIEIVAFALIGCNSATAAKLPNPPQLLYTDIVAGPNDGGENNNGAYLSLFGRHFGESGLGTRVKVFINNFEVDNYRYLGSANTIPGLQQITVQVGRLGNPVKGVNLPIKVVVDGVSSNSNHHFMVNPGTVYFVSLKGSDFRGDGSLRRATSLLCRQDSSVGYSWRSRHLRALRGGKGCEPRATSNGVQDVRGL